MIIYLGGADSAVQALKRTNLWDGYTRRDFLATFHNKQQIRFIEENHEDLNHIFIDSGAFSFMNSTFRGQPDYYKKPEHKEFFEEYCDWVRKWSDKITVYAVLDIIGNEDETFKQTDRMEKMGLTPLPIFHLTSPTWKYLEHYIEKYDYLGIGGAVRAGGDMTTSRREVMFKKIYEKIRNLKPDLKIHALGITSVPFLKKYEVYSCDSVSWAMSAAMGGVLFFQKSLGRTIQLTLTNRVEDCQKINGLSDPEWKVVQQKLDKLGLTVDTVRTDIPSRRSVNLIYFQEIAEYLTEYYEQVRSKRRHKKPLF